MIGIIFYTYLTIVSSASYMSCDHSHECGYGECWIGECRSGGCVAVKTCV